ncbi:MAG TPA: hypothetical protein H9674_02150 [Firmicutes bacterium]|nr:hypothetical protein [Bacillota bacterium]
MNTETMNDRAQLFGKEYLEKYARSRRVAGIVMAVLCVLFLAVAQAFTYVIAQRAGLAGTNAAILAAVPFVGPAFLCVETAMAGWGEIVRLEVFSPEFLRPLLLLCALVLSVLFLFLGAHCHDLRRRALGVLAERQEAEALLAEKQAARQKLAAASTPIVIRPGAAKPDLAYAAEPAAAASSGAGMTPAPAVPSAGKSEAPAAPAGSESGKRPAAAAVQPSPDVRTVREVPVPSGAGKTAAASMPPQAPSASPAARPAGEQPMGKAENAARPVSAVPSGAPSRPAASVPAAAADRGQTPQAGRTPDSSLQKAEEEYNRAMQDVLAFLNKK